MSNNAYMTTYQERLSQAMAASEHFSTPTRLAREIGCSSQAISQALSGASRMLGAQNHSRAAQILGVSTVWLATGSGKMVDDSNQHHVPAGKDPLIDALAIIESVSPAKAALYRAQIMAELENITQQSPPKKGKQSA